MENIEEQFDALKKQIAAQKDIEINKLKTEVGQLEHQKQQLWDRLNPLLEYEQICKQVDGWKEKELTITVKRKDIAKNIMAFARRYHLEVDFFVEAIMNSLFVTSHGRSTLGMIIGKLVENVRATRETTDTEEARTAAT